DSQQGDGNQDEPAKNGEGSRQPLYGGYPFHADVPSPPERSDRRYSVPVSGATAQACRCVMFHEIVPQVHQAGAAAPRSIGTIGDRELSVSTSKPAIFL